MSVLETLGDNYAFVFPGQGSQTVGMGRSLAERSPAANDLLKQANDALQMDLGELMFNGPEEALADTYNSQPAIYTASAMALASFGSTASASASQALAIRNGSSPSNGSFCALMLDASWAFA